MTDKQLEAKLQDVIFEMSRHKFKSFGKVSFQEDIDYCNEVIGQILQAFKDAGWVDNPELTVLSCRYNFQTKKFYDMETKEHGVLMTGQEWYDRFLKQLDPIGDTSVMVDSNGKKNPDVWTVRWSDVGRAAKRAAGLEE